MHVDSKTRPVPLHVLSGKECCLVAAAAERRCIEVLTGLAQSIEHLDLRGAAKLREVAAEEARHLQDVLTFERDLPWPKVLHLTRASMVAVLKRHLPALFAEDATRAASPDEAFASFRQLEHEAAHFYRELGTISGEPASRAFFCDLAEREGEHAKWFR
ncbi:MAG TPA: hypothetical protein VI072_24360 [Polyangiaceae bacterium]